MAKYVVRKGDTLSKIAKQYGMSVNDIAKLNNIADVNKIRVGQELNLGEDTPTSVTPVAEEAITVDTPQQQKSTADWLSQYETLRPTYQPSPALQEAANMLRQAEANKPGPYQSTYAPQIQNMLDQILNREKFSYDFNADPLYQQYAQRYQQQGKLAMMDTMGQAASLTGGYANSYATAAGQQAYQGYLQGLNDTIPQLQQAAYQRYRDEGDTMYNNIGLLQTMDNTQYNRYRDTVSDWQADLNYAYMKNRDMTDDEYNRYLNDQTAWENDRAYWYNKSRDEQQQQNWQTEFDYQREQDALKLAAAATAGKGRSGPGKTKEDFGTQYSTILANVKQMFAMGNKDGAIKYLNQMLQMGGKLTQEGYNQILYVDLAEEAPTASQATDVQDEAYQAYRMAVANAGGSKAAALAALESMSGRFSAQAIAIARVAITKDDTAWTEKNKSPSGSTTYKGGSTK